MTLGAECGYSTTKSALSKYTAACQYVQPDFTVSAKLAEVMKTPGTVFSGAYYHKVSSEMQVGAEIKKAATKSDVDLAFGCLYKLDKNTTVKGKVRTAHRRPTHEPPLSTPPPPPPPPCRRLRRLRRLPRPPGAYHSRTSFCVAPSPLDGTARCAPGLHPNPNPHPNPNQVDSDGKLFASFKQQLSPLTLLTLASEVETVNLNEGKHKFGMALSLTP